MVTANQIPVFNSNTSRIRQYPVSVRCWTMVNAQQKKPAMKGNLCPVFCLVTQQTSRASSTVGAVGFPVVGTGMYIHSRNWKSVAELVQVGRLTVIRLLLKVTIGLVHTFINTLLL
jgi:hypothetical protein